MPIAAVTEHFCGHCNRLRLTADRQLRHCLLDEGRVDLSAPLRSGAKRNELVELIREAAGRNPLKHAVDGENAGSTCRDKKMSKLGD